jgi:hypothetical protein
MRCFLKLVFKSWTDDDIKQKWSRVYDYISANSKTLVEAGFFLPDPVYKEKIMRHQLSFFIKIFRGNLTVDNVKRIQMTHKRLGITNSLFDEMLDLTIKSVQSDNSLIPAFAIRESINQFRAFTVFSSDQNGQSDRMVIDV